ncbi:MAG TPA: ABC transporter permease [Verrucomicrobiae bacterium]|nr:ABC transporter permease [Verrucomicrobiae bacterium]
MRRLIGLLTIFVYAFMHLPIIVIIIFSFSKGEILSLPIPGWTLDWYRQAINDERLRAGLLNSLKVATVATIVASILGTLGAYAVQRYRFFGRQTFRAAVVIPILLPGIITGVAMLTFFAATDIPLGLLTVMIGHATFGFPVIFNTMAARLSRLPRSLEEAAADLGANPVQAFWRVGLPSIRTALMAGALLAFTLSFDEIIVTIFLTGNQNTLPMEIWARLRFGMTPEINATVTIILLVSGLLVVLSQRLTRE